MRYAFESGLPDPGLKQAFVLDFLTGAAAAACLVQIIAPDRIDDWGLPGRVFMTMRSHFWPSGQSLRREHWRDSAMSRHRPSAQK